MCSLRKPLNWGFVDAHFVEAGATRLGLFNDAYGVVFRLSRLSDFPAFQMELARHDGVITSLAFTESVSADFGDRMRSAINSIVGEELPWLSARYFLIGEQVVDLTTDVNEAVRVLSRMIEMQLASTIHIRDGVGLIPALPRRMMVNAAYSADPHLRHDAEGDYTDLYIKVVDGSARDNSSAYRSLRDGITSQLSNWIQPGERLVAVQFCCEPHVETAFIEAAQSLGIMVLPVMYNPDIQLGFYYAGLDPEYPNRQRMLFEL
ncbi:hypothetical protein HGA91_03840 [candidate division WWE3 bacterium]|nr:hypothetical protein [candidate division WWE3 bacterium]